MLCIHSSIVTADVLGLVNDNWSRKPFDCGAATVPVQTVSQVCEICYFHFATCLVEDLHYTVTTVFITNQYFHNVIEISWNRAFDLIEDSGEITPRHD